MLEITNINLAIKSMLNQVVSSAAHCSGAGELSVDSRLELIVQHMTEMEFINNRVRHLQEKERKTTCTSVSRREAVAVYAILAELFNMIQFADIEMLLLTHVN